MTTTPDNAIEIRGLSKTYAATRGQPAKQALRDVDLTVPRGAFFALLGPNGAGKSTLINIMAGVVRKTSGTVKIWDANLDTEARRIRMLIGVMPQEINFDPFFSPRELLNLHAGLYGVPLKERNIMELLDIVGLADKADTSTRSLSGGMRRRLLMAKALVHRPPILVLDEPTAGVDIELRQLLWERVKELRSHGATILLTTHYLEEAEKLCDQAAIIDNGQVVVQDHTANLLRRLDSKTLTITTHQTPDALPEALQRLGATWNEAKNAIIFNYHPSQTDIGEFLAATTDAGLSIADLVTREADLEDIFLQLTSRPKGHAA